MTYKQEPCEREPGNELSAASPPGDIERLCEFFQKGMAAYWGTTPKISAQWATDMDLLVRRGPVSWAKEKAIPTTEVAEAIRGLFTKLTVANGGGDFCWAKVVRSPTKLRLHWDEITAALKQAERTATAPQRKSRQNDRDPRSTTELRRQMELAELRGA